MQDPYVIGAAEMLGIPPTEVTSAQRAQFKNAFLMSLYSAGENKLLDSVYNDLEQRKREKDGKQ